MKKIIIVLLAAAASFTAADKASAQEKGLWIVRLRSVTGPNL